MIRLAFPKTSRESSRSTRSGSRHRNRRSSWAVEPLESRQLLSGSPTIYTVTSADSSATEVGTLPYEVGQANANANPAGSEIVFSATAFPTGSQTQIKLTSPLELSETSGPEMIGTDSSVAYSNVSISGNQSVGVFVIDSGVSAQLDGLQIANGSSVYGGDVFNSGSLRILNCTVEQGSALQGGGDLYNSGPSLSIVESKIALGSAFWGGGIDNESGTLSISGSMITSNSGSTCGGGIYNIATTNLLRNYFVGNSTAGSGGAIDNLTGTLTSAEEVFVFNSAHSDGGAIANESGNGVPGTLTTVNDSIAFNYINTGAKGGAGVYAGSGSTTTLDNTIVAYNVVGTPTFPATAPPASATPSDVAGTLSSTSGYNLIGVGGSGGLVNVTNGNLVGVADSDLGFDFSSLGNNGGLIGTIALMPNSPAIDAGSNALAVDPATGSVPQYDARGEGYPRVVNGTVDIGSYLLDICLTGYTRSTRV